MNDGKRCFGMMLAVAVFAAAAACGAASQGAKVYQRERCKECHTLKGAGGSSGPNLTTVGARRTRDYIRTQIKNPKSHNPNTDMPSFGHLPEQDLNALTDYLAGLK